MPDGKGFAMSGRDTIYITISPADLTGIQVSIIGSPVPELMSFASGLDVAADPADVKPDAIVGAE